MLLNSGLASTSLARALYVYGDHTVLLADTSFTPLDLYSTPTLPNNTFVFQKHILIPFLLLCSKTFNKPLALNNLHPSTLDYHI